MSHTPEPVTLTADELDDLSAALIVAWTHWPYPHPNPRDIAKRLRALRGHDVQIAPVQESA